MIDCFSRRLVGWSIADHMRTELVENALSAAALTRGGLAVAVFYADHGSHYTSKGFAMLCAKLGVVQSMGAVGASADNALAESFNATLKRETLQQGASRWESPRVARLLGITPGGEAGGVPVGHSLQHLASALVLRLSQSCRLRNRSHIR